MDKRIIDWKEYQNICSGFICVDCLEDKKTVCQNFTELPSVNTEVIHHLKELKDSLYKYLGESVHISNETKYAFGVADTIINKKIIELEKEDVQ